MKSIAPLKIELNTLKDNVIGLFKVLGTFELVINHQKTNSTVDTISITSFGAVNQNYGVPVGYGNLVLFPNNKNMNQMLEQPYLWDAFLKQFN